MKLTVTVPGNTFIVNLSGTLTGSIGIVIFASVCFSIDWTIVTSLTEYRNWLTGCSAITVRNVSFSLVKDFVRVYTYFIVSIVAWGPVTVTLAGLMRILPEGKNPLSNWSCTFDFTGISFFTVSLRWKYTVSGEICFRTTLGLNCAAILLNDDCVTM